MDPRIPEQYQLDALEYARGRLALGTGSHLLMEMRLGKSLPAKRHVIAHNLFPCLVLCPAKVLPSWVDELRYSDNPYLIFAGTKEKKTQLVNNGFSKFDFVVASYNAMMDYGLLNATQWKHIILDESYILANAGRNISVPLWQEPIPAYQSRSMLSGAPFGESISQLVTQYICTDGHLGPYRKPYEFFQKNTYTDSHGKLQLHRGQAEQLEAYMRQNSFCRTRAQCNVGGAKRYSRIWCDLPEKLRKTYNEVTMDYTLKGGERFQKLWLLCSGLTAGEEGKVESFHRHERMLEWVKSAEFPGKVVVFCKFLDEVKTLKEWLAPTGIPVWGLTGSTTFAAQSLARDEFWQAPSGIAILQEDAFKYGGNWSCAKASVYFSNSTSGDSRIQSEDRIIHLTKTEDSDIIDLCVRQGACAYVADMVRDKYITHYELLSRGAALITEIEKWQEK